MVRKTVLIAGAHGLIGRALIEQLDHDLAVNIIGLGRRGGAIGARAHIISVDLLDPVDCAAKLGDLAMLRNLMQTVSPVSRAVSRT